jgi:iron complex outermembrane receptor protein
MTWDNQYTLQTEREVTIFKGESSEDLLEDFGTPEHRLVSTLNFSMDEWNWMIMANYMSGTQSADDVRDTAKCDVFIKNEDLVGKPQTVPVCSADSAVYVHTSVTYTGDDFLVTAGMKNVFDKAPELVDLTAGSNRGNMVTSSGYDLYGRSFFLNASYRF